MEAKHTPGRDGLLAEMAAFLAPFVEDGSPIRRREARDLLRRLREAQPQQRWCAGCNPRNCAGCIFVQKGGT